MTNTEQNTSALQPPVMRTLDLRGQHLSYGELRNVVPRQSNDYVGNAAKTVDEIIARVRAEGADYLRELSAKFDGVEQGALRVPAEELSKAVETLDPQVKEGLEVAIERTRAFAQAQRPDDRELEVAPGAKLTFRWTPVRRAGVYVPGGLAVYPSSVIMNIVPAQAAGVDSIVLCTPPQEEFGGLPHPTILAAAHLLGVEEVWAVGGAQALAAMAYGVDDAGEVLESVDTITGPGNIFVALAKRALQGVVGIDGEAGTTEIAVIADETANPDYVAADLISQAEHDPNAGSILITHSAETAEKVAEAIRVRAAATKHAERVKTALEGPQSGVIFTDNLEQSIAVADAYAAEHLEIHTANAAEVASKIRNAGAIFIGPYSPVPLGDYAAGSNHVLPTAGSASFASGLNTTAFMKAVQLIEYTDAALAEIGESIIAVAHNEDLPAHGEAITARTQDFKG
ncbi:histidinol dehydrogenase [Rothia aerolata]|uniref:Histidinol dehydrogenase n=1 Tax=Rothia aerolata TaxID=1812262 RepID=A0A917MPN0_9MICC|nr:histidinol dehydrogenase [Rothia aerolata]GGH56548.1 histidinol dehydrogenase [Rothia aerolata]